MSQKKQEEEKAALEKEHAEAKTNDEKQEIEDL